MTGRAVLEIGFPLWKIALILDAASPETNTGFDVSLALDHDEAAGFVRADWDKIALYWQGTAQELRFLRAFIAAFPEG